MIYESEKIEERIKRIGELTDRYNKTANVLEELLVVDTLVNHSIPWLIKTMRALEQDKTIKKG